MNKVGEFIAYAMAVLLGVFLFVPIIVLLGALLVGIVINIF